VTKTSSLLTSLESVLMGAYWIINSTERNIKAEWQNYAVKKI